MVIGGEAQKAINTIKNIPKTIPPYEESLYLGFLEVFMNNQKQFSQKEARDYYNICINNQETLRAKYPYRARIYLTELTFISSQTLLQNSSLNSKDITLAKTIYASSKDHNINGPDIDFFYAQSLLKSPDQKDQIAILNFIKNAIIIYPEVPKFY